MEGFGGMACGSVSSQLREINSRHRPRVAQRVEGSALEVLDNRVWRAQKNPFWSLQGCPRAQALAGFWEREQGWGLSFPWGDGPDPAPRKGHWLDQEVGMGHGAL